MGGNNGYNTVAYRAKNGVCTLYVSAVFGLGANSEYKIANTIDAKYLPDLVCYCPLAYRQSNNVANVWIPAKTLEDNHLYIYSTYDNSTNLNSINGIVSWVYQHSVSHDYIVAQGTSGIWFYRKWNSGLAEFWGGKEIKGIGSVTAPAVDFPFPLTILLYKGASAIYSSGQKGVYVLSGTGASVGLVNTGVYVLNQDIKDNNSTTVAYIEYNVKGMWK